MPLFGRVMIDRRYIRYFDWVSFGIIVCILCIGLVFVFSTTSKDSIPFSPFFKKQLFGAVSGIIIYLFFSFTHLQAISKWGYVVYIFVLALLFYTMVCGLVGMGAKRWISLHFLTFQPSELVKIALPLSFGLYFEERTNRVDGKKMLPFSDYIFPIVLLFITFVLVLKQPDLGTALVIAFSGLIILWLAHIPKKFFIFLFLACALGAPLIWGQMKDYQKHRIFVLMGYGDSRKERYQVEQSKIAIGSGGFWGKGFMEGTQNRLSFLPEARTDFIFSVLCEEWGFIGALAVLLLFILLFIRLITVLLKTPPLLDQLIGMGLLTPIILSTIINIGMVSGIFPIVGIPLPLFTYGVTNLWITCASFGILNNICLRRMLYTK